MGLAARSEEARNHVPPKQWFARPKSHFVSIAPSEPFILISGFDGVIETPKSNELPPSLLRRWWVSVGDDYINLG
jgi:hypothetical protein